MGPGSAMGTRAARTEPPSKDMRKASPRAAGRVMEKNGFPVPVLEVSWGGERGGPGSLRGHPGVWVWSRRTGSRCHPGSRCPAVAASRGVPERAGSIVTVTELSSLFVLFSFSRSEAHPARPRSSPLLPKQPKWLSGGGSYASPSSKLVSPGGPCSQESGGLPPSPFPTPGPDPVGAAAPAARGRAAAVALSMVLGPPERRGHRRSPEGAAGGRIWATRMGLREVAGIRGCDHGSGVG